MFFAPLFMLRALGATSHMGNTFLVNGLLLNRESCMSLEKKSEAANNVRTLG
jgi:hypothetical protein